MEPVSVHMYSLLSIYFRYVILEIKHSILSHRFNANVVPFLNRTWGSVVKTGEAEASQAEMSLVVRAQKTAPILSRTAAPRRPVGSK